MKTITTLCAAAFGAALLPATAAAQSFTLSYGVALTSRYVSDGVSLSGNNAALQGYIDLEASGFYVNLWASTVNDGVDNTEVDLAVGYRNELPGGFSYDVGYVRYFLNNSGASGELLLTFGVPIGEKFALELFMGHDFGANNTRGRLTGSYAFDDRWTLSASYGYNQANANNFYDVGVSYSFTENFSADLRYHDTTNTPGLFVLTLAVDF